MNNVFVNKQGVVQWRDLKKSMVPLVLVPVLTFLITWLTSNNEILDWRTLAATALSGFLTYLTQQAASPAKVITTFDTNEQAESVAADIKENQL